MKQNVIGRDSTPVSTHSTFLIAASIFIILIGTVVFFGWQFDIPTLQHIRPTYPKMVVNTAVTFALSGLTLLIYTIDKKGVWRYMALVTAILVIFVGLVTFMEYILSRSFGIDELLLPNPTHLEQMTVANRPSPQTTVAFILAGFSLLLIYPNTNRTNSLAQYFALIGAFIPLAALVGYGFAISYLFHTTPGSGMALHSALTFIILFIGIIYLIPNRSIISAVTVNNIGGMVSRRLLWIGFLLLVFFLIIIRLSHEAENIAAQFEVTIVTVLGGYVFSGLTIWFANSLNRIDSDHKRAEEKFRLVVETSPNAIVLASPEGNISLVNSQAEILFGYSREELLKKSVDDLVPAQFRTHHSDYRAAFFEKPEIRPMGVGRDLYGLRKDGSRVPIEIGLSPIETSEGTYAMASIVDITERKLAEKNSADLLEREHAARMKADELNEELKSFSYSVSHDLRAPLLTIDGFSQALLEDYLEKLDDEGQHYLRRIQAGSQRMNNLIDDMLVLSRMNQAEIRLETVNLSEMVEEIAFSLQQADLERQVKFVIAPDLTAEVDRQLIRVALENLFNNSWKFTSKCEFACIEFGLQVQDDGSPIYYIRDNGAGFDMTYADKLFVAFQRLHTSTEFSGTGIGLATVQRVIHRHGGRVWAEGKEGSGATVYFTL